ncbi:MAG: hypothetical protein ACRDT4_20215 [Micromonosporaceae bacterium]
MTERTSTSRASTVLVGGPGEGLFSLVGDLSGVAAGRLVRATTSTRSPGRSTAAVAGSASCTGTPTSPAGTGNAVLPDGIGDADVATRHAAGRAGAAGRSSINTAAAVASSAATTAYRSRGLRWGGRNRTGWSCSV